MQGRRMGGKKDLHIFLKGGHDLDDVLPPGPGDGRRSGPGPRELIREKYRGAFILKPVREPHRRADLLLQHLEMPAAPDELRRRGLDRGPHAVGGEWGTRLLEEPSDVVLFSLLPDLTNSTWRHRRDGYLVDPPPGWEQAWTTEQREWFAAEFAPEGLLAAPQYKEAMRRLIGLIKQRLGAHVLVQNCSSVDPDDDVYNYHGRDDTPALRAHKFNLALMELSVSEGISIIDVDRLIAEMGGDRHAVGFGRYSDEANEAIGAELVRVLEDIGFFEERPLIMQVGRKGG